MDASSSLARSPSASNLAAAFTTVRTSVLVEAAGRLGIGVDRLRAELAAGRPLADVLAVSDTALSADAPTAPVVVDVSAPGAQVDLRL